MLRRLRYGVKFISYGFVFHDYQSSRDLTLDEVTEILNKYDLLQPEIADVVTLPPLSEMIVTHESHEVPLLDLIDDKG